MSLDRKHCPALHEGSLLKVHRTHHEPILPQPLVQHLVELAGRDDVLVEPLHRLDARLLQSTRDVLAAKRLAALGRKRVDLERQRREVHAQRVEPELHAMALVQVVCDARKLDPVDSEAHHGIPRVGKRFRARKRHSLPVVDGRAQVLLRIGRVWDGNLHVAKALVPVHALAKHGSQSVQKMVPLAVFQEQNVYVVALLRC